MADNETPQARIKRLRMRSMRRGIKEMDLILSAFADVQLETMSEAEIQTYDALLNENDQDLLTWVTGQVAPPDAYSALIKKITVALHRN